VSFPAWQKIHESVSLIEPRSDQFAALQRTYFRMMEKYLDAGTGACRLSDPRAAGILITEINALHEWQVDVRTFQSCRIIGTRCLCHALNARTVCLKYCDA
jgi:hypothetical protein